MDGLCCHGETTAGLIGQPRIQGGEIVGGEPIQGTTQAIIVEVCRGDPRTNQTLDGLVLKESWSAGELPPSAATPEPDVPRFRASGSSVLWLIVIGYRQPGHSSTGVPCCFPIVTVPMKGLKVLQCIFPS